MAHFTTLDTNRIALAYTVRVREKEVVNFYVEAVCTGASYEIAVHEGLRYGKNTFTEELTLNGKKSVIGMYKDSKPNINGNEVYRFVIPMNVELDNEVFKLLIDRTDIHVSLLIK